MMVRKPGYRLAVAWGCTHRPFHDQAIHEKRIELIKALKPNDLYSLGDEIDYDAGNKHEDARYTTLDAEFESMTAGLKELRTAAGKSCTIRRRVDGNHEHRLNLMPECIRAMLDPATHEITRDELALWGPSKPYVSPDKHCDESQQNIVWAGQVGLMHGFSFGANSDKQEALLYGVDFGLSVRVHTHRPLPVTRAMATPTVPTNRWFTNIGTGAHIPTLKLRYANRINTRCWGHGTLVFQYDPDVRISDKRCWEAVLLEHSPD